MKLHGTPEDVEHFRRLRDDEPEYDDDEISSESESDE